MTERIGVVVNVFDDRTAEVMTDKKGACGGCEDSGDCKTCLAGGEKVVAVVRNDPCACPGDLVVVEHTRGAILGGAALFYVLPIVGLMVGAFVGGVTAGGWGMDESAGAIIAGLLGLSAGLLAVFLFSRTAYAGKRLVPRIVRIVEHGDGKTWVGTRRPAAAGVKSCCAH